MLTLARGVPDPNLLRRLRGRLQLQFVLALQDRTPLLVVGYRHATFHANLNSLLGLFGLSQQSLQKRHETSVFLDTFDGRKGFKVGPADTTHAFLGPSNTPK